MSVRESSAPSITFSRRELRDLAAAWIALSVAFAIFFDTENRLFSDPALLVELVVLCFLTVGVGFMLHELAHKVVAVRFGQIAAFRASYNMLVLAIFSAMIGFIFAAPGAVQHRGRITERQHGLISVAGPWTNLLLVGVFAPLLFASGFAGRVGQFGVVINAFLAAFNMIPYGPLDGATVKDWSIPVFLGTLLVAVALTALAILFVGIPDPT